MTRADTRAKALDTLFGELEKIIGKGAGRPLPEQDLELDLPRIGLGSIGLDYVTGGGLPRGRIVEFYGAPSSGKTLCALRAIAQCQAQGGTAGFIDAEHSFDPEWAKAQGVNVETMLYVSPDTGEQALEAAERMARSGAVDLIVVDSVSALVPEAEIKGDMGDAHMGLQARLMSQACRKLVGPVAKSNCILLFINQLREKIGDNSGYGIPETTTGGRALPFYASVRVDFRRGQQLKDGETVIGQEIRIKTTKNKTAAPFRKAIVPFYYRTGIDAVAEVFDYGMLTGKIVRKGAWYYTGDEQLAQGRNATIDVIRSRPELQQSLTDAALALLKDGIVDDA